MTGAATVARADHRSVHARDLSRSRPVDAVRWLLIEAVQADAVQPLIDVKTGRLPRYLSKTSQTSPRLSSWRVLSSTM